MKVIFSCDLHDNSKKCIENLLNKWKEHNLHLKEGEWVIEILKILSRDYTKAITFLARYGQPRQKRIARVFKVDDFINTQKEAIAATRLDNTISAKFFCRMKNNPEIDFWIDETGAKMGIIEYEYAGDMGAVETVDTLFDYIFDQYKQMHSGKLIKIGEGISLVLDDVIQGLKTKLYKREKLYNINGREIYQRKLKHFNAELVNRLLLKKPDHLKSLFNKSPQSIYDTINNTLNTPIETHYTSEYIHGDLNPTNILVYRGYDRVYGTLIDFLEMENKKEEQFTPYFWDFARLEVELTLAAFTKGFISLDQIQTVLPKLEQALFNMEPIVNEGEELAAVSDLLVRLRKSFFRTEGLHLDISYNSPDVVKSFYYNVLVFYIFMLKYENSELEVLIALAMAYSTAQHISKIDSKWVAEKLDSSEREISIKSESQKPIDKTTKKPVIALTLVMIAIGIIVIISFIFFYNPASKLPETLKDRFKEAESLASEGMCKETLPICKEILSKISKSEHPKFYARTKKKQGFCYYKLALSENQEKNLKQSILSSKEALKIFKPEEIEYATLLNTLGLAYMKLSEIRKKGGYLQKAFQSLNQALKLKVVQNSPIQYAITQSYLGIAYWRFSELDKKKENLNKTIELLNKSLQTLTPKKHTIDYASVQNYLGNAYGDLSSIQSDAQNKNIYLQKALESYRKALEIRTLENDPIEHALTQHNYAEAYWKLSYIQNSKENLKNAINAYDGALQIDSRAPFDQAMTHLNLGIAYKDFSMNTKIPQEKQKYLKLAFKSFNSALTTYKISKYPLYHAKVQINIGINNYLLFELQKKPHVLEKTVKAYKIASKIYTSNNYPDSHVKMQFRLGEIYSILAGFKDKKNNLIRAIEAYKTVLKRETLNEYTRAIVQEKLGYTYFGLSSVQDKKENLQKAKDSYNKSLNVFTKEDYPLKHEEVMVKLKKIK